MQVSEANLIGSGTSEHWVDDEGPQPKKAKVSWPWSKLIIIISHCLLIFHVFVLWYLEYHEWERRVVVCTCCPGLDYPRLFQKSGIFRSLMALGYYVSFSERTL